MTPLSQHERPKYRSYESLLVSVDAGCSICDLGASSPTLESRRGSVSLRKRPAQDGTILQQAEGAITRAEAGIGKGGMRIAETWRASQDLKKPRRRDLFVPMSPLSVSLAFTMEQELAQTGGQVLEQVNESSLLVCVLVRALSVEE